MLLPQQCLGDTRRDLIGLVRLERIPGGLVGFGSFFLSKPVIFYIGFMRLFGTFFEVFSKIRPALMVALQFEPTNILA